MNSLSCFQSSNRCWSCKECWWCVTRGRHHTK